MRGKNSYIPYKVIVGYLLLIGLIAVAGYIIYSESTIFSTTENKIEIENSKVLKVSALFSKMYETESQARLTILSNSEQDYQNYINQTNALKLDIDTLKTLLTTDYQTVLLDSVKFLLTKKTNNIQDLKIIKSKATGEIAVKKAINDLTKMELTLQKLRLEDFVKNPSEMGEYQRNVLIKYVDYLNKNIPSNDENTLSQKALDSMLVKSKNLLKDVKQETAKRNEILNKEEKNLLQNELSISEQLRKIIRLIENEIIIKTTQNNVEKENSLKKTNKVITITAIVGLLLTVLFSVLVLNDFSKSQSYKKQLEIANLKTKNLLRNREQLIATVSHDLKTPLNTIMGYSELLSNSELSTKQLHFTTTIKNSSEYITHLVNDLLDLTQLEAGKITLEKNAFSLPDLLVETSKNIQSAYSKKEIDLQFDIDEKLNQKVISDSFRIKQILSNIIGNGYKFTEKGFIKINAKVNSNNTKVTISVEDSGIGIEDSKQDLIFEEFTQANDSIEKTYGGSGLGLTISKKLTEILGGTLTLKSAFEKGSTFIIELPIEFETSKLEHFTSDKVPNTAAIRIIIIDDDANLLQLTNEILKQQNFKTYTFTNAKAALDFAKNNMFDLILTDIQMPETDGFEFLKQLKIEENEYKNQPIIAVTGRTDLPQSDYILAGFKMVISKPYSPKKLLNTIQSILNNTEVTLENAESDTEVNKENEHYSLQSLKSFFPNDSKVINEVLSSFIVSTKENIRLMEASISGNNLHQIKEIAHKMYPMFRQIESNAIGTLLENLENETNSIEEVKTKFEIIKDKISDLILELNKEIS
jgi:signal transduction histidine kinase/DNA-binding response OmpR family regulator